MTAAALIGCALTLLWIGRLIPAMCREQAEVYRGSSISPDLVNAEAAELNAALDTLLDGAA